MELSDDSYDGVEANGMLTGGLGQLVDGIKGEEEQMKKKRSRMMAKKRSDQLGGKSQ